MPRLDFEFEPDPLDAASIDSRTRTDLAAFNHYVEQELSGVRLFGAIVQKLSGERPDETQVETDIASGKVGLEVAEITGSLPERLTNPDTPITQTINYPPVGLPDGNYALLSEEVHRDGGIDGKIVARIPWLHIMPEEALTDFQNGQIDYLSDATLETYCRSDFDTTGRTDDTPPFSTAHRLFFLHPLGQEEASDLEHEKQELLQHQDAYLARLQTVARIVLGAAPEGSS
jgi:hypothetical protein